MHALLIYERRTPFSAIAELLVIEDFVDFNRGNRHRRTAPLMNADLVTVSFCSR